MSARVSIIVNNYNYGRYLRAAIDSALGQQDVDHDVWVVDDGSTDDSREILRSYGDRIQTLFKENGGQASAFNAGFAAATGEWILFLDADDVLDADACAKALEFAKGRNQAADWIEFRLRCIDPTGAVIAPERTQPRRLDPAPLLPQLLRRGTCWFAPTSGMLFARRLLQRLLPMPTDPFRICADLYLQIGATFLGTAAVATHGVWGGYRLHGGNHYHRGKPDASALDGKWSKDILLEDLKLRTLREFAARKSLPEPSKFAGAPPLLHYKRLYLLLRRPREAGQASPGAMSILGDQVRGLLRLQAPREFTARIKILWLSWLSLRVAVDKLPEFAVKRVLR